MASCRTTKQSQYTRDEVNTFGDTTITLPMITDRFDIDDIDHDTTIVKDDATLQIIHDTLNMARIYYLQAPRVVKLDSVIRNRTIREVYRVRIEKQSCNSKYHHFTTSFFQWVISIVLLYVGIKAIVK